MAASCSSSMACFHYSIVYSRVSPAAAPRPRSRRFSFSPVFRLTTFPASRTLLQLKCASVRACAIRSEVGEIVKGENEGQFVYTRARPEVRWPQRSDGFAQYRITRELGDADSFSARVLPDWEVVSGWDARLGATEATEDDVVRDEQPSLAQRLDMENKYREREAFRQRQKGRIRRMQNMSNLALRKANDWNNRASRLSTAICELNLARPIADVLSTWPEQLNNDEMCVVVRNLGEKNWRRSVELYGWLNLQKWYTPSPRFLATVLSLLGKANQLEHARELFLRAESKIMSCIQVFNAILGAYAKQGQWQAAQYILELMELSGCEPDIVTFNTIASAQCKHGLHPGMASALLREIEASDLRPDIITYNTLLGGCITNKNITEALELIKEMELHGIDLNTCTSYVSGKEYLQLHKVEKPVMSILDESSQQQVSWSKSMSIFPDHDLVQQKESNLPKARSSSMRLGEAEGENVFCVQGAGHIVLTERSISKKFLQVWHDSLQFRLFEFTSLVFLIYLLKPQLCCSTVAHMVESNIMGYARSNFKWIKIGLQSSDSCHIFAPYACYLQADWLCGVQSMFQMICLFMQWKTIHVIHPVFPSLQPLGYCLLVGSKRLDRHKLSPRSLCNTAWILNDICHVTTTKSYKHFYSRKAPQATFSDMEETYHLSLALGQMDSYPTPVRAQETTGEGVQNVTASTYTKLINECMMNKDYLAGLKHLVGMVDAGIEPGYMTWICVLQACGQCAYRIDFLRLLAGLRDAGCPLPLRVVLERETALPDLETWLRNLQTMAADGGQGMVNNLVDSLWAFKLRATAAHVYDLAVRLDMYPRNFSRVEEQNWEADLRNFSPGIALVAMNRWLMEMQVASFEGFPEPQKEVLMITGTQGYQNGISLNKTIRAHLWEMGSPFFMRPPREGALITKGHALRLWLKDSPRCFNLELEDDVMLPRANSMTSYKSAWMSSDAVPVMKQIHTSIGEVWPRKYSKLAHMSETRRIEALAARLEGEKRRKLESRVKTTKKKPIKKNRSFRPKDS
nr:pentatricopeptide repeat-containing protein At3g18110, chloroplastic-like isoform X3 [Physcomitrium patens]|eukprot:XP_024364926.1 pentatricopeptide repeat-containing protein At3g18110, chloroplastic-like isoform X3 [Physcomitrella patens]